MTITSNAGSDLTPQVELVTVVVDGVARTLNTESTMLNVNDVNTRDAFGHHRQLIAGHLSSPFISNVEGAASAADSRAIISALRLAPILVS